MRPGRRSGVLWMLVVLVGLSGGCGGPQYDTPESTFQTAKSAVASYDCEGFCGCLTSEARDWTAAGMVVYGCSMQLVFGGERVGMERARVRAKRLKAVLGQHGCKEPSLLEISFLLAAGEEEQTRRMLALVEPIKDRNAFIGDFIRTWIETADEPDVRLVEPNARLVNLKIESDTATATFAQTRQGQEKTGPIKFERVDGEWKISRLPLLQLL